MGTGKLVFRRGVIATSLLLLAGSQVTAAAIYPQLSLPASYSLRQVPVAWYGPQWITVAPGVSGGSYTLSGAGGTNPLAVAPASGPVPAGFGGSIPFWCLWFPPGATGPKSGTITLTDGNPGGHSGSNHTMTVTGAVLANRTLTATPLLWPGQPERVMQGNSLTSTLNSGAGIQNDDNHATRVNMVAGGAATNTDATVTVTYSPTIGHGGRLAQFNSPGQSVLLTVTPTTNPGRYCSAVDGPLYLDQGMLTNGEASSVGAVVQPVLLDYDVAVLQNRTLTVQGALSNRVMLNTAVTGLAIATGDTGDLSQYDYYHETCVNPVLSGSASNGFATVRYSAPPPTVFYTANQQAPISVSFNSTGAHPGGSINVTPTMLANGEPAFEGAVVKPVNVAYGPTTVVAQRALSVGASPITFNNVLKGTYVGVPVTSIGDDAHATRVMVAPGGATVGPVAVQQTLVNSASATVYGQVTAYQNPPPASVSVGTVAVANADTAAGAPTNYPNLTFKFSPGNVGNATLGSGGSFGPALTGFIPRGLTLGNFATGVSLSSSTANAPGTLASAATVNLSNVYGPVGSEAQILTSTAVPADTTVSMAWRPRTSQESSQSPSTGLLPPGVKWLTSDVVRVGGIPASASNGGTMAYAMQMSFDSRINDLLDGSLGLSGTALSLAEFGPDAAHSSLYLAEFVGSSWQNAVTANQAAGAYVLAFPATTIHVNDSLSDFLTNQFSLHGQSDTTLEGLVGSWGVDITNNQAWAIVNHAGTFAVVPEPTTLVLLISAGAGAAGYVRWRRRRRC
ncbi:MAG: PEP-CTERM sorting domain-containing protein [Thermoguttaceae bacterium]